MRTPHRLILLSVALAVTPLSAQNAMRGPLPAEQRDLIHHLAEHHHELKREVTLTKTGYTATTTSANKDLVAKLKKHVAYMKKRLDSGAMVRRWDPAYAELVEHYPSLKTKIEPLENGLRVTITATDPEIAKVAQNHAKIVTGFTKEGTKALHREHPAALQSSPAKK